VRYGAQFHAARERVVAMSYMVEPADLSGWVDRYGTVWVRVDDLAHRWGHWWPVDPDGGVVGGSVDAWSLVDGYGPFVRADAALTRLAVDKVRARVAS
jgi:hypothetical protein